jgi:hypothetical protein
VKPVVFSIRYSVLSQTMGVEIRKNADLHEYKRRLFDPHRMAVHHTLFERLTIPSLARQDHSDNAISVCVMTSTEMPEDQLQRLQKTLAPLPWARIVPVSPDEAIPHARCMAEHMDQLGISGSYAHVRLDDDDAVSDDFCNQLRQYIRPELAGYGVSFVEGFFALYDSRTTEFLALAKKRYPMNSVGLAVIGNYDPASSAPPIDVFSLGVHTRIDQSVPTILDGRFPSYIRTLYSEQDTASRSGMGKEPASTEELLKHFSAVDLPLPTFEDSQRLVAERNAPKPVKVNPEKADAKPKKQQVPSEVVEAAVAAERKKWQERQARTIKNYENSTSWKITGPLRTLRALMKKRG